MKFDLHNHTVFSDGVDTIESLANKAWSRGVTVFAITDHDTVLGAKEIPAKYKDRILPGIEFSSHLNGDSVHIVGLFKHGYIPQEMIDFSHNFLEERKNRCVKMMQKIKEIYGVDYDLDDLLKDYKIRSVTRGNMLRNLMKVNNITMDEAREYICNDSKAYIPVAKVDPKDAIDFLHKNNCFVILAHPVLVKRDTLDMLVKLPFDGMEARYPKNTKEDDIRLKNLAIEHNFVISAGSDCHGDNSHANIGTATLNEEEFKPIAEAIGYDLEAMKWK